MPSAELVGQQIRIRMKNPKGFDKFRTDDVGKTGKLQRIAGYADGRWVTQSWRLNLSDYSSASDVKKDLDKLIGLTAMQRQDALSIAEKYFKN